MVNKVQISDAIDSTSSAIAASSKAVKTIHDMIMPIGSVYVQFAGQSAPADVFGGTWSNVSSSYAGNFFRAEGGNAAAFGSSQTGGLPNIVGNIQGGDTTGVTIFKHELDSGALYSLKNTKSYAPIGAETEEYYDIGLDASKSSSLYGAASEVRPINSTIRIWKRTA